MARAVRAALGRGRSTDRPLAGSAGRVARGSRARCSCLCRDRAPVNGVELPRRAGAATESWDCSSGSCHKSSARDPVWPSGPNAVLKEDHSVGEATFIGQIGVPSHAIGKAALAGPDCDRPGSRPGRAGARGACGASRPPPGSSSTRSCRPRARSSRSRALRMTALRACGRSPSRTSPRTSGARWRYVPTGRSRSLMNACASSSGTPQSKRPSASSM